MTVHSERETISNFTQRNDSPSAAENIGDFSGSSPSQSINVIRANVGAYSNPWDAADIYQFNLTRRGTILMDSSTHLVNVELFDSNNNLISKSLDGRPIRSRTYQGMDWQ